MIKINRSQKRERLISERERLISEREGFISDKERLVSDKERLVLDGEQLRSEIRRLAQSRRCAMMRRIKSVFRRRRLRPSIVVASTGSALTFGLFDAGYKECKPIVYFNVYPAPAVVQPFGNQIFLRIQTLMSR